MTQLTTWDLKITPAQFKHIYGDKLCPAIFTSKPSDEADLVGNYLASKLWRLNRLYTIVDKNGKRVPFRMNYAQHVVYAATLTHPRIIILKSRQQGISTFWLISYFDDALVFPDFNVGLMAQGQAEARTLLKRVGLAWTTFPEAYKDFLQVSLQRDNTEEQGFSNNSTLFIRTSFRSATLQRLHISEFGKIANKYPERAKETKTGTLQAISPGNTVVIESTGEGENEFKRMWDNAVEASSRASKSSGYAGKDFQPVFLSWLDDPDCTQQRPESVSETITKYFQKLEELSGKAITQEQRNFWIAQYRELGEAIYQEYPATPEEAFAKINDGSYYASLFTSHVIRLERLVKDLHDPNLPVHVSMDLGMSDTFTLTYFQRWGKEWRIVDEYANSGEGLAHYVTHMQDSPYTIGTVVCPHDIEVRELSSGKSRKYRLVELGVSNIVVVPKLSISDGIERVRELIPDLWVDERCTNSIGAFKNYSKDWNDQLEVWRNQPRHDKWSHYADGIRYMALSNVSSSAVIAQPRSRASSNVVDGLAL